MATMEVVMSNFFQEIFCYLERDCLFAGFRRRKLCDYLSTLIFSCSENEGNTDKAANTAVLAAIDFHKRTSSQNGNVCLMGKYHNVLYVATRIAFIFGIANTMTVRDLLHEIFVCERTFERLISGAIFGPKLCSAFSGWKSEFISRKECMDALRFFLNHATLAKMEFTIDGEILRMADVPMQACMRANPVTVAIHAQKIDTFLLLVGYGAKFLHLHENMSLSLESMFSEGENERIYDHLGEEKQPCPVPSLKHQARLVIRDSLNVNFQLPLGVNLLPLPKSLLSYITLDNYC